MANPSLNIPATLEEKLKLRLLQAKEQGKEYNEAVERRVLGLPPVEGRPPLVITADMVRAKSYTSLSNDAIAELESSASGANMADMAERLAIVEAALEEANRQNMELQGIVDVPPRPTPSDPNADPDNPVVVEGWPNAEWKLKELVEWNAAQGLPPLPNQGVGQKKLELVELILRQAAERGIEPADEEDAA